MEKKLFNLTNPQKSILLTEEFYKNTNINNICGTAIIDEVLDFDLLKKAMKVFAKNHDSFNMKLVLDNNEIKQYLDEITNLDIEIVDIDTKEDISKVENDMLTHIFDIYNGDLFSFKIFRLKDKTGGFIVNVHHLFGDSWSLGILANDIVRIYSCLLNGEDVTKNDDFSYIDYIYSEKEYLSSDKFVKDKEYWNSIYSTIPEQATIPGSISDNTDVFSCKAERQMFNIDTDIMKKINDFCKSNHISVFNFFMAIYSIYIGRVSRLDDFVIGTPILNRTNFKEKNTTGMFINTAPLRITIDDNLDFKSFVSNIAKDSLGMLRHQKYYYQNILEDLRKDNPNLPNLYNTIISYQVTKANTEKGLKYNTRWNFNGTTADDIDIHLFDLNDTGSINVAYDYKVSKYTKNDVENLHNRILHMITQVVNCDNILTKDIEIVTSKEKYEILYKFNNTDADYPCDKTIVDLFEEQVEKTPNNIAVVFENQKLTYRELNEKANQLARYLITLNINKNSIISLYMNKNLNFIVSILAIQKLGCAYLPIHPDYPSERVNYIIENSNSVLLITDQNIITSINQINFTNINIGDFSSCNINIDFDSNSLAYVIYTSGSTGKPKGVMLTHKNLINFLYSFNNVFNTKFSSDDNCLSLTNISFDVSVCEIFTPLIFGSTLVLYPENTLTNIPLLCSILSNNHISFLYLPPNILDDIYNYIKDNNINIYINKMLVGVEPIKRSTLNKFYTLNSNIEIVNGYGPTETTICCTFYKYNKNENLTGIVPIGKPLNNNHIYILNKNKNIQPIGIVGEIYVSGNNVALGYLNNEDLTKSVFLDSILNNDLPTYKTGDLAYWNKDGNICFVGRNDSQIKLNGHRIELGEINNVIKNLEGIANSITMIKEINNISYLCSYVVSKLDVNSIKNALKKFLPYYMIPTYIQKIETMPITMNGKIDKTKLPDIISTSNVEKVIPTSDTEIKIFNICSKLLKNSEFGIHNNLFELGADSLHIIRLCAELYNCFNINVSMKDVIDNPTIYELANFINTCNSNSAENLIIESTPKQYSYPLSSAQKRIYYESKKIGNNSLVYNVSGALLIDDILEKSKIENAFKKLINRHSIFRTNFIYKDNQIEQHINESLTIEIPTFTDNIKNIDAIVNNFQKPFNLEKDLLLRIYIYYLDNKKTLLLIDSHHIAVDGISLNIFIEEFCKLYNDETLEDLKIDYKDFSVWENKFIHSEQINSFENYWMNKFKNSMIPSLNLPYDYTLSNNVGNNGNRITYKMDYNIFEKCENLAKELNVSTYSLFLSVLLILLYKYTNQEEIIVGSVTVGRQNSDLYKIIGNFVNNIVIDAKLRDSQSYVDFVHYINKQVLNDLEHQLYPYDLLVNKLSKLNSNCRNSIFDVCFAYQNANMNKYSINDKDIQTLDIHSNTSKFNLLLDIQPINCSFSFEYNTNLFKEDTIQNLLDHYIFILNQIINNKTIFINNINIITDNEFKLLDKFNNTYEKINDDTFVSIFENEVKNNPDNIALICDDKYLTYNELNKKANSLAHYLIKNGISRNDIVCIMTNRSLETIVSMLGILKAGACFFNVDPTYPIERTKYYIENSKTKYVLTQRELKDKVKQIENCIEIDLDNDIYNNNFDNPNVKVEMNDLSYIIYTSGSTGTPKGVMLNQVGLANMVKAMYKVLDYLKEGNRHTIVSVTSTPFDIFVYEIVVSLGHGLKVVMANNAEHRNPKLLDALIRKYNVDVMTVTPSLMKINYDNREPNSALALVKNMVFGGEPLPEKFVKDLKALADDITIYNIYGPSEITVLSNVQNLDGETEITVGPPIMNTQIHILDKNMKRVPIGVVGEIYISGIQVGLGYIGKPEMTAEKFMDNPFGPGKIYKSGDIGRWTFDGKVQCLGRIDHQIKLRGLRIELGEIENIMQNINGVTSSVVNKVEIDGKEILCGYYVADNSITESMVKDTLRNALPYYMVPSYIIRLEEMPYTINRKIDRKALPLPELSKSIQKNKVNIDELNSNEEKLLQIWRNILKIDDIDVNDNFFDIGGDSVYAIQMQIEALKYGLKFEYADIFNYPTIKQLSNKLPNSEMDFLNNYDYTKANEVLSRNIKENLSTIKDSNINNILLIGSTGFLGAHIVDQFLKSNSGIIYCLIRPKNNIEPIHRLKETLSFYFGNSYFDEFSKRIRVIIGDITKENLGLSDSDYNLLSNNVDVVINSGAMVKHFGLKDEFTKINVIGTQNVVNFCKKENKRLLHISTISVSGNGEKEESVEENPENINDKKLFYETNLYIGQNIKGVYTTTKFEAELIVLNAIYDGLDAQILRLGNITNRYSDGLFQLNIEDNAFAKRLKSFVKIGAIPKYITKHAIELTPVDLAANAIIKILNHNSICNMFHIYDVKLLPIKLLLKVLNSLDIELLQVSDTMMADIITGILQDNTRKDILSGIIYDLNDEKKLIYTSNIRLNAEFTEEYLKKIGFSWYNIDEKYLLKYINYFKKIKFI